MDPYPRAVLGGCLVEVEPPLLGDGRHLNPIIHLWEEGKPATRKTEPTGLDWDNQNPYWL